MDALTVRDVRDRVGLEVLQVDPGHPPVRLIVDEQPAAVVVVVGLGDARVVGVAPRVAAALLFQHLARLRVVAEAAGALRLEHRDPHQLPHRREPDDADLAGVAAGEEPVVLVVLARSHRVLAAGGRVARVVALLVGEDARTTGETAHGPDGGAGLHEVAASELQPRQIEARPLRRGGLGPLRGGGDVAFVIGQQVFDRPAVDDLRTVVRRLGAVRGRSRCLRVARIRVRRLLVALFVGPCRPLVARVRICSHCWVVASASSPPSRSVRTVRASRSIAGSPSTVRSSSANSGTSRSRAASTSNR